MVKAIPSPISFPIPTADSKIFGGVDSHPTTYFLFPITSYLIYGDVLVSTGVVRLDKRVVAPDHDKTGTF